MARSLSDLNAASPSALSTRWQVVSAAPHRPMFLIGAVQLVLVMAVWFAELLSRQRGAPLPFTIVSTWAHVLLMLYGLFIFFIYGFLLTVFPRWMGGAEVPRRRYMTVAVTAAVGMAFVYVGFFSARLVLAAGLLLHLLAWLGVIVTIAGVYRRSPKRGAHEALLIAALALGAFGVAAFMYGVLTDDARAFEIARAVGVWGFLTPVLLIVSHRMIPFFTHVVLPFTPMHRAGWSLAVFAGGSLLHGVFEFAGLPGPRLVVDAVLAWVALYHTVLWGFRRSFAARLLAMLHIAFLWFGIAMALYAAQAAFALAGDDILGRAPLHALGIGFVTSTLIAMATRVTLGHSGRALAVQAPTWYLFLGVSAVALTRVAAELAPAGAYPTLNLLAAAGWLICTVPWFARYAPIYWRPRIDRRPG